MAIATWDYEIVPGQSWVMDSTSIPMDGPIDLRQNLTVYMEQLGDAAVWTNESI